jgi:hypothetical protein
MYRMLVRIIRSVDFCLYIVIYLLSFRRLVAVLAAWIAGLDVLSFRFKG